MKLEQLQKQLSGLEKELECAREQARSLREELHRVTVELAEKSARVQIEIRRSGSPVNPRKWCAGSTAAALVTP